MSQVRLHSTAKSRPLSTLQLTPQSANTPTWVMGQSLPAEALDSAVPFPCPLPQAPTPPQYTTKRQMGQTQGWWGHHRGWEELSASSRPITSRDLVWLSAVGIVQNKQKLQAESKHFARMKNVDKIQLLHSEKRLRGLLLRQQRSSTAWAPTKGLPTSAVPSAQRKSGPGPRAAVVPQPQQVSDTA